MFGAGISLLDRSLKKMGAKNLLIIMSDQHNKKMLGCYGHPVVRTPNLDTIAKRGTLAEDPVFNDVLDDCEAKLRQICDPKDVDRRAKAWQADLLEAAGGREAVIAGGDLGFTPAPGTNPEFE